MNTENNILLASHGTKGALAAEQAALELCKKGDHLHHLYVVPSLWEGMTGDDWLNNGVTRNRFRDYVESELSKEVDETINRLKQKAEEQEVDYLPEVVVGEPDDCLLSKTNEKSFNAVVMGSPRPKGEPGLRSRMITKKMQTSLSENLVQVPFPNE